MNNKIFTFFILIILASPAFGQHHICGVTQADQAGMLDFIDHFNKTDQPSTRSVDPVYVPMKFHMTSNNDGTGRIKASSVLEQMTVLINDYKEFGIYLYIQDANFEYLNSTLIYNNPGNSQPSMVQEKDSDAINVFITENANVSSGPGVTLGYYTPSGDYLVVRNTDILNATSTLTHELGHFFSLPHPFIGWENVYNFYGWVNGNDILPWNVAQFDGMYTNVNIAGTNSPAELVNQSNCMVASDRICDTPPDYNFGLGAGGCNWNSVLRDRNGDLIEPMENNFMSYFSDCADYAFTDDQVAVMNANYNSNARAYIRSEYIPDTTIISSDYELTYPASSEKLEFYNKILLDWTDADGAGNYLVSINSQSGEFTEYFVTESQLFLEELDPNTFYFWNVKPFNEGYTDTEEKNSFFTTGADLNTSVEESNIIQNISVYPNPGQTGQDINVSISMEETKNVAISIVDITGKQIHTSTQNLNQGNNNIRLEAIAQSGIYILKLDTEDGSLHKKIVIQ